MKFKAFKEFRLSGNDPISKYLSRDLVSNLRELSLGLERLTFKENFISFEVTELSLPAGTEVAIENPLTVIPTKRLITRQSGGGAITDGVTDWALDFVYLRNEGGTDATISAVFLR